MAILLEKGHFFRSKGIGINFIVDKWQDEDTGKWCYEFLKPIRIKPLGELINVVENTTEITTDEKVLHIEKIAYNYYDLIDVSDIIRVFINDVEYVGYIKKENNELITYLDGTKYYLKDLIKEKSIRDVTSEYETFDNSINNDVECETD